MKLFGRSEGRTLAFGALALVGSAALIVGARGAPIGIGSPIELTSRFRVMQSDLKTGVGLQEAAASGVVTTGPVKQSGQTWWFVDFSQGADGWVSDANLNVATAGATVSLSASPQSIAAGETTLLTWTSTNSTSCMAQGGAGFSGTVGLSGSIRVIPNATKRYRMTCTGAQGSAEKEVVIEVNAPPAPTVSLIATPTTIASGGSSALMWSAPGGTGCVASGGTGFSGTVAATGSATVRPTATTTYQLRCQLGGAQRNATAVVTIGAAGAAAAFANPDNGAIPDRAKHPMAFPTAIGFGKQTSVRASNAVVYKINTLEDVASPGDGKISYRECALALPVTSPYAIPADRPRYCVFDVAGAITLQSPARITKAKIYIAGQTSPGGIEFRLGSNYNPVDSLIDTRGGGNDMILRHVRTRTGTHVGRASQNGDPIRISGTRNQIIDHVSTMFGTDESLDMVCTDCTVQWSIIGPNICRNAGHTSSLHCKTFFLKPSQRVTIAHNLSQHGEQRGINIATGTNPAQAGTKGQADIFNNVLYHFATETGLISNQFGSVYTNYINNVSLRGPRYNNRDGNYLFALYSNAARTPSGFNIYASGNVTPNTRIAGQMGSSVTDPLSKLVGFAAHVDPNTVCGVTATGAQDCSKKGAQVVQQIAYALMPGLSAPGFEAWQVTSAEQALRDVLAYAGADRCRDGLCRDNVDAMYIEDLRTCDAAPYLFDAAWPGSVAEAGGWARITAGAGKVDTDNDGMPDEWERRFTSTNPAISDANADTDGDGYPNIEEYLNALAQDDLRYSGFIGSATGKVPAYNCGRPMA